MDGFFGFLVGLVLLGIIAGIALFLVYAVISTLQIFFDQSAQGQSPIPPSRTSQQIIRNTATNIQAIRTIERVASAAAANATHNHIVAARQLKKALDEVQPLRPGSSSYERFAHAQRCKQLSADVREVVRRYDALGLRFPSDAEGDPANPIWKLTSDFRNSMSVQHFLKRYGGRSDGSLPVVDHARLREQFLQRVGPPR